MHLIICQYFIGQKSTGSFFQTAFWGYQLVHATWTMCQYDTDPSTSSDWGEINPGKQHKIQLVNFIIRNTKLHIIGKLSILTSQRWESCRAESNISKIMESGTALSSLLKDWELLPFLLRLQGQKKEMQIKRDWLREEIRQRLLEGFWPVLLQVTGG